MALNTRLFNNIRVDVEARPGSTVAGSSVSRLYDMTGYEEALFICGIGPRVTNSSVATCATVVFEMVESSAATVAGTTLVGGKATIAIGAPSNTAIGSSCGITGIVIQSGSAASVTAATTGDAFRLGYGTNIVTFTYSSEASAIAPASTVNTATAGRFGPSSGAASTADTGGTALIDSIRTALQNTKYGFSTNMFRFTTPDTGSILIEAVNCTAPLFYSNTMATTRMIGSPAAAALAIGIRASQLTSTLNKKYVGLRWSTLNEAAGLGITCIRSKGKYMPGGFCGLASS